MKEPPVVHEAGMVSRLPKVPSTVHLLGGAESQGITVVERVEFTRPMQTQIWL